jgi:signal transduction histidine kinase
MPDQIEIVNSIIYTFVVFILMAIVLFLFFYFSRKKILKNVIEKKELEVIHQKELLHSILITQEAERKRIAQDLHDDISSKLNVVSLNFHLLKTPNLSEKELQEITDSMSDLTKKALENSRKIAHGLLPPVLVEFGLNAGIEELVLEFNSSKKVYINYTNSTKLELDDLTIKIHIYRILQELINNSIRHGKATKIEIGFNNNNNIYTCTYTDNGIGFKMNTLTKKGLGLNNIQSRIEFVKGTFNIKSNINEGVQAFFSFQ